MSGGLGNALQQQMMRNQMMMQSPYYGANMGFQRGPQGLLGLLMSSGGRGQGGNLSTPQLYQHWVDGLLQPYQPQQTQQPQQSWQNSMAQLFGQGQNMPHSADWYDPRITPSGGGQ